MILALSNNAASTKPTLSPSIYMYTTESNTRDILETQALVILYAQRKVRQEIRLQNTDARTRHNDTRFRNSWV